MSITTGSRRVVLLRSKRYPSDPFLQQAQDAAEVSSSAASTAVAAEEQTRAIGSGVAAAAKSTTTAADQVAIDARAVSEAKATVVAAAEDVATNANKVNQQTRQIVELHGDASAQHAVIIDSAGIVTSTAISARASLQGCRAIEFRIGNSESEIRRLTITMQGWLTGAEAAALTSELARTETLAALADARDQFVKLAGLADDVEAAAAGKIGNIEDLAAQVNEQSREVERQHDEVVKNTTLVASRVEDAESYLRYVIETAWQVWRLVKSISETESSLQEVAEAVAADKAIVIECRDDVLRIHGLAIEIEASTKAQAQDVADNTELVVDCTEYVKEQSELIIPLAAQAQVNADTSFLHRLSAFASAQRCTAETHNMARIVSHRKTK